MFGLFIVGQLVLIIASIAALAGLLLLAGGLGSGWVSRLVGGGVLLMAAGGFFMGAWASREFSVQSRS